MTVIDLPVPSDSITNKQATQKSSLYHTCRYVLNALSTIHSLQPYLALSGDSTMTASTPMSRLWQFCRLGTSLCIIFNTLRPDTPIPLDHQALSTTAQKPKAYVYHFIIACRDQLHFSPDTLFTLKDLFQDDTNGFVRVVNILKRVVDIMESQGIITIPSSNRHESDTTAPKDTRDKIVIELLETERKYVQDLETLQSYMRQAKTQEVLPPDTLHQLFGNLNALVDCQRRFLIQVEAQADGAPQDQRFGQLFMDHEEDFAVYEPFCANFQTAQSLVCREQQALEKLSHLLSPSFELPSILIKPVQRLCKYPLLMKQLVKTTPSHWPFYDETKQGLDAIQRVAAKVNETRRRQENLVIVRNLKDRVDDWPTSDIDDFGPLLLHDKFMVYRGDPGRELIVYLFEKCLFVCREEKEKDVASSTAHGKDGNKKSQKKNKKKDYSTTNGTSSSSPSTSPSASGTSADGSTTTRLGVRGRILMSRVAQVNDTSQEGGAWTLQIFWSEKYLQPGQQFRLDSFTLKCRHQEQLQLWESSLNRLIKQMKQQAWEAKAATAAANAAAAAAAASATASLQLSSPETPSPPMVHDLSHLDSAMHHSQDEKDDILNHDDDEDDNEGKATIGTRSDDEDQYHENRNTTQHGGIDYDYGLHPPTTPLSRQHYNNLALGMTLPPLPRFGDPQFTSYPPSPNSYASSSYTPHSHNPAPSSELLAQDILDERYHQHYQEGEDHFDDDYDTYSSAINTPKTPISFSLFSQQQQLQQSTPDKHISDLMCEQQQQNNSKTINGIPTRLRSQSSPNIHPSQLNNSNNDPIPSVPAFPYQSRYHDINSNRHNEHQHRFDKRKSNGDQDIRRPLYAAFEPSPHTSTSTTTTTTTVPHHYLVESLGSTPTATKVKVHHLGSIYVLVVPLTIDYKQLVERIEKKMKCDTTTALSNNNKINNSHALAMTGLKYQDEEGDLITISSNDDLQMGFELRGANNTVNFYIV